MASNNKANKDLDPDYFGGTASDLSVLKLKRDVAEHKNKKRPVNDAKP